MKLYYQDSHVTIYNSDCRSMQELPDNAVQCCVTSPPYWGLRLYKGNQDLEWGTWNGQLGLEPTPELYLAHLVQIFREVKRVLRPDGVAWINVGDSYFGSGQGKGSDHGKAVTTDNDISPPKYSGNGILKPKDLCLIPFRLAIALQMDGWWVRSVIIWQKPNPMPESVKDRPTESHEYILMLTKSAKYYFDMEAVKEPAKDWGVRDRSNFRNGTSDSMLKHHGLDNCNNAASGRNLRSVWTFPTASYRGSHFAVFPEALPERCIKAATSEVGHCSRCGMPWVRVVEKKSSSFNIRVRDAKAGRATSEEGYQATQKEMDNYQGNHPEQGYQKTIGWKAQCTCNALAEPDIVLDPFGGTGTSAWVAKKLGRKAVIYELSEEYCKLAVERNKQQVMI